jgi:hypothetical protein
VKITENRLRRSWRVHQLNQQRVSEELGFIPSFADWVKAIRPEPWMGRAEKLEQTISIPDAKSALQQASSDTKRSHTNETGPNPFRTARSAII